MMVNHFCITICLPLNMKNAENEKNNTTNPVNNLHLQFLKKNYNQKKLRHLRRLEHI